MERLEALFASPDITRGIAVAALVFARVVPIVMLVPAFGGRLVPGTVKVGIAAVFVMLLYPAVSAETAATLAIDLSFVVLVLKEVLVGVTIGFLVSIAFSAIESAGALIDTARGATLVTALVPELGTRDSVVADLKFQLAIVLFFAFGGHLLAISALIDTFNVFPVDRFPTTAGLGALADVTIRATSSLFVAAFSLAAPVWGAAVVADVLLALLSRVAPQMNAFALGMPLKAVLGVFALLLALSLITPRLIEMLVDAVRGIVFWVKLFL
ncbi:MAG: flagellar biosynthetic protein FliR [Deltaproteobacteria bacterium]|nr:flagellar biosynthetic protein FliR [Deltaproteobacteria bacterium]